MRFHHIFLVGVYKGPYIYIYIRDPTYIYIYVYTSERVYTGQPRCCIVALHRSDSRDEGRIEDSCREALGSSAGPDALGTCFFFFFLFSLVGFKEAHI